MGVKKIERLSPLIGDAVGIALAPFGFRRDESAEEPTLSSFVRPVVEVPNLLAQIKVNVVPGKQLAGGVRFSGHASIRSDIVGQLTTDLPDEASLDDWDPVFNASIDMVGFGALARLSGPR
ncbi:hypothetical protein ACIRRA_29875 [Nocardia sp. NPDC101769]|uniref:hypothetical protein n=1 Tax=Nocardia sp. NPDC101769 TaxID=3364333 RepID=UPI0037F296E0